MYLARKEKEKKEKEKKEKEKEKKDKTTKALQLLCLKCWGMVTHLKPGPLMSSPESRKSCPVPVPSTLVWCGRLPVMNELRDGPAERVPHTLCHRQRRQQRAK